MVSIRSSGDTVDHVDGRKSLTFLNNSRQDEKELAGLRKIEAVSGATLTSMAIADAIALRFGGEKSR